MRDGLAQGSVERSPLVNLTVVHSQDTAQWERYLRTCLDLHPGPPLTVASLNVTEEGPTESEYDQLRASQAALVIVSPQLLQHPLTQFAELCRTLRPGKTVAMMCGVAELPPEVRPWTDTWKRLVARNNDRAFVQDLLGVALDFARRPATHHDTAFKLVPRKVTTTNNKVYVLLNKPLCRRQKVQVFLDNRLELPYEWLNPYTLHFKVPESCLQSSRLASVDLRWEAEQSLGSRPLKIESRLSELYNLLAGANAPNELLCQACGVGSLHEVDAFLTRTFRQRLPRTGFHLLDPPLTKTTTSEEVLPTLLHFSCHYGFRQLTETLIDCPGARQALRLANCDGLTPLKLAAKAGHLGLLDILQQCQTRERSAQEDHTNFQPKKEESVEYETMQEDNYDHPKNSQPIASTRNCSSSSNENVKEDNNYLEMIGIKDFESLPPHMKLLIGKAEKFKVIESFELESTDSDDKSESSSALTHCKVENFALPANQHELIEIMEAVKNNTLPIADAEKLFLEWQEKHKASLQYANKEEIKELREIYKNTRKHQKTTQFHKFFKCLWSNILSTSKDSSEAKANPSRTSHHKSCKNVESEDAASRPLSTLSNFSHSSTGSSGSDRSSTLSVTSSSDSGNHSDDPSKSASKNQAKTVTATPAPSPRVNKEAAPIVNDDPIYYNTEQVAFPDYINCAPSHSSSKALTPPKSRTAPYSDYDIPQFPAIVGEPRTAAKTSTKKPKAPMLDKINKKPLSPLGGVSNLTYFLPSPPASGSPDDNYDFPKPCTSTQRLETGKKSPMDYYDIPRSFQNFQSELDNIPSEPPPPPPRLG